MSTDPITVHRLGKTFRRYSDRRPRSFKEAVVHGKWRIAPIERFWVFRDMSFKVSPGDTLGVIGQNGVGKSTLLRLVGGVGRPDEGFARVQGRVGSLLELGSGFHPDLTGRENVFVSGVVDGLSRRRIAEVFDEIVEFAELRHSIDNPLRTYSSGMQMRLAFSVAVHGEPQALLIDEVLSVGDIKFQRKCLDRITKFRNEGSGIILVSHDMEQVKKLCNRVLWLKKDSQHVLEDANAVVSQYEAEMHDETRRRTPTTRLPVYTRSGAKLILHENRFGSLELEIVSVHLFDRKGSMVEELVPGDSLNVQIEFVARQALTTPIFGVTISDEEHHKCCEFTSRWCGFELPKVDGRGAVMLKIDRLDLTPGRYFIDTGVYDANWAHAYDFHWRAYSLTIAGTARSKSTLNPPHSWWEMSVSG